MSDTSFIESPERQALRKSVAALAANYGQEYFLEKARNGGHTDELWREAGELGFIGVNLPEEYGGGGAGMYELAMMMQKAATLYDAGDDMGAAEAANMAKYAAGEASTKAVDQAVQSMGGNGLSQEYGVASMLVASRLSRIAPVSREMVLNFIAQTSLGLPRSY